MNSGAGILAGIGASRRHPLLPAAGVSTGFGAHAQTLGAQRVTVRGVRLRAILDRAGLAKRDRFDWRNAVGVVTATDGYRTVFSWPELVNTEAGAQVLVVYERDGAPLNADEGPLASIAAADVKPDPRHVKWLASIEVRILSD